MHESYICLRISGSVCNVSADPNKNLNLADLNMFFGVGWGGSFSGCSMVTNNTWNFQLPPVSNYVNRDSVTLGLVSAVDTKAHIKRLWGLRYAIHSFIQSSSACLSPVAIQQYYDASRGHTEAGWFTCFVLCAAAFSVHTVNLYVYIKLACHCWVSVWVEALNTAGFTQIIPGGPVNERYQCIYLASEAAVFLCILSEVDEVLPLGPVYCFRSHIRGRIGCAW